MDSTDSLSYDEQTAKRRKTDDAPEIDQSELKNVVEAMTPDQATGALANAGNVQRDATAAEHSSGAGSHDDCDPSFVLATFEVDLDGDVLHIYRHALVIAKMNDLLFEQRIAKEKQFDMAPDGPLTKSGRWSKVHKMISTILACVEQLARVAKEEKMKLQTRDERLGLEVEIEIDDALSKTMSKWKHFKSVAATMSESESQDPRDAMLSPSMIVAARCEATAAVSNAVMSNGSCDLSSLHALGADPQKWQKFIFEDGSGVGPDTEFVPREESPPGDVDIARLVKCLEGTVAQVIDQPSLKMLHDKMLECAVQEKILRESAVALHRNVFALRLAVQSIVQVVDLGRCELQDGVRANEAKIESIKNEFENGVDHDVDYTLELMKKQADQTTELESMKEKVFELNQYIAITNKRENDMKKKKNNGSILMGPPAVTPTGRGRGRGSTSTKRLVDSDQHDEDDDEDESNDDDDQSYSDTGSHASSSGRKRKAPKPHGIEWAKCPMVCVAKYAEWDFVRWSLWRRDRKQLSKEALDEITQELNRRRKHVEDGGVEEIKSTLMAIGEKLKTSVHLFGNLKGQMIKTDQNFANTWIKTINKVADSTLLLEASSCYAHVAVPMRSKDSSSSS